MGFEAHGLTESIPELNAVRGPLSPPKGCKIVNSACRIVVNPVSYVGMALAGGITAI
jgi:hypothetical protein